MAKTLQQILNSPAALETAAKVAAKEMQRVHDFVGKMMNKFAPEPDADTPEIVEGKPQ